jgi:hypothetical protein
VLVSEETGTSRSVQASAVVVFSTDGRGSIQMAKRLMVSIFLVAAMLATSMLIRAQTAQRPAAGTDPPSAATPDLSGIWDFPFNDDPSKDPRVVMFFTREEPSMLPWAQERYKAVREGRDSIRPDMGRQDMDPAQYPYCMPFGMPRAYTYIDPIEIVQSPGRVYIFFESSAVQRIYTDGRKHPVGAPITFMGHSIGRWEGDTLVVETIDMNELSWLDSLGHPHTDALRVEQRIRRLDHDTLEINFLFDDPKTYTKPWTGKKVYKLRPSKDVLMDYFLCEDRMREEFPRNVLGKKEAP